MKGNDVSAAWAFAVDIYSRPGVRQFAWPCGIAVGPT